MPRSYRIAKAKTRRFTRQAGQTITRAWNGLAQVVSKAFRSHAAWSAKGWAALYDPSILENDR